MEVLPRKCNKCKQTRVDFYKNGKICLQCQSYKVSYKKEAIKTVERCCLMCDKKFQSSGNRRCESCNSFAHDSVYSTLSSFVSIGS